jgi:hypothetical protein
MCAGEGVLANICCPTQQIKSSVHCPALADRQFLQVGAKGVLKGLCGTPRAITGLDSVIEISYSEEPGTHFNYGIAAASHN